MILSRFEQVQVANGISTQNGGEHGRYSGDLDKCILLASSLK
jgi:hypothetical protein